MPSTAPYQTIIRPARLRLYTSYLSTSNMPVLGCPLSCSTLGLLPSATQSKHPKDIIKEQTSRTINAALNNEISSYCGPRRYHQYMYRHKHHTSLTAKNMALYSYIYIEASHDTLHF